MINWIAAQPDRLCGDSQHRTFIIVGINNPAERTELIAEVSTMPETGSTKLAAGYYRGSNNECWQAIAVYYKSRLLKSESGAGQPSSLNGPILQRE